MCYLAIMNLFQIIVFQTLIKYLLMACNLDRNSLYVTPTDTYFKKILLNKFEVSKIYMTACMCIYKFCQIKKYMFMIFFYSKTQMIFVWIFMIFHVLLHFLKKIFMFYYVFKKVYSRFFRIFQDISRFFKIS